MERRKDTPGKCARLPRDYLSMIEETFNKHFKASMTGTGKAREGFIAYGEIYPDEVLLTVSLKNPVNLRMITCYTSVDFPPSSMKKESGAAALPSGEGVEMSVNYCIDATASFFATFFSENRPLDYEDEYRQNWTAVDLDKTTRVFMRINRDNPELESEADAILTAAGASIKDGKPENEEVPSKSKKSSKKTADKASAKSKKNLH